jgi:HK97 gp10 family phage protein
MASVKFSVDGLKGLESRFLALAGDMQLRAARAATYAAAAVVKQAAQRLAPTSDRPHKVGGNVVQPGNLKRNIIVKRLPPGDSSNTSEHIVTVRKKGRNRDAFYGRFIEFGTVKMSPKPFLRPALLNEKNRAADAMAVKLAKSITKAGA